MPGYDINGVGLTYGAMVFRASSTSVRVGLFMNAILY